MSDIYNGWGKEINKAVQELMAHNKYAGYEVRELIGYLFSATRMKIGYTIPAHRVCSPLRIVVGKDGVHHKVFYGNLESETVEFMKRWFPNIQMIKVKVVDDNDLLQSVSVQRL